MKRFTFEEGAPLDLQAATEALFDDSSDPASTSYKRVLLRPQIAWGKLICGLLFPVYCILLIFFSAKLSFAPGIFIPCCLGAMLIYTVLMLKPFLICCIRIYQRYAPASLRNKCRYEPSCSQYMIRSIQKYGAVKGVKKGISRLLRCKPGFGGFDEP